MVKKNSKPAAKKAAPIRRTKTIQEVIEDNQEIVSSKLGSRRSQTNPKKVEKSKVPAVKLAIKKAAVRKAAPVKEKILKRAAVATPSPKKAPTPKKAPASKKTAAKKAVPVIPAPEEKKEVKKAQPVKQEQAKGPRRTESKATAGIVDVVFCCDTTGSMGSYLNQTKSAVKDIVHNIQEKAQSEDISVKFGFVCYRDHPPQDTTYVTKVQDLCDDDAVIKFIEDQNAAGGGDAPEAALDGLYDAGKKISWRDSRKVPSLRYVFHIADAPPHGAEFGCNSQWSKGVPSGVTLDKVIHVLNIREIHYRLIKIGTSLDKMAELLKQKLTNFEETTLAQAKDMNIRISDMIIRELLPDVDYNDL